jgi:phosphate transport system substrate-binding protein
MNMNKIILISVLALSAILFCTTCKKEDNQPFKIEGLTLENFPLMDGSTSTDPLVRIIASKLLGYNSEWDISSFDNLWYIQTDLPDEFVKQHLKSSQTHNAFINLIDKKADIILSARAMSPDEKAYSDEAGVSLIETPIALDALIFVVNPANRIKSLTHKQIQDIYTLRTTNWNEVGGNSALITPYVRNKNSGSQELFETLVLPAEQIPDDLLNEDNWMILSMQPLMASVHSNVNGLGYTPYYYREYIIRDAFTVNALAVNGVNPDKKTIRNRSFPYTAEVYAIIRSDLDKSSMAYKIRDLLLTSAGRDVITESGYVPY